MTHECPTSQDPPKVRPIRVGVIGSGQFMSRQHIQTIHRSDRLTLWHLAAKGKEEVRRVADRYEPVRASTRWQDVVCDPEVDVVVVGVVPDLHPEIAAAAIEHGKPVYVEKPLAKTAEECRTLERLAAQRRVPLAVGFNRRFAPATEFLYRAFRQAGSPVSVQYRITDDDRIRPPEQSWKKECRLMIEAVHIFDLLAYLLDAEPVSVYATEARFNDASVLIEFSDGSKATFLCSSHGSLAQPKERLDAVLDRGAVEMIDFVECRTYGLDGFPDIQYFAGRTYDDCDNSHVVDFVERGADALLEMRARYYRAVRDAGVLDNSADPEAWDRFRQLLGDPPLPQINYAPDKGWGAALEEFCIAAVEGKPIRNAGPKDGLRATACAAAARQSIKTRRVVRIP